ncbi:MAG TPA: OB-fold domain-containing protein [Candidatus Thermoplasmatota archaeon]|nr:OB-fold domain-containing protein [Candidatus Thermoplasmatota archaeon]
MSSEQTVFTMEDAKQARKDGKLMGWKCAQCGHTQATPMFICSKDMGRKIETVELPGEGEIVDFTVQKISSEDFINDVPFAFVLVKLTNGVHISGWVPDIARDRDLPLGTKVRYTPSYRPGIMFEKA